MKISWAVFFIFVNIFLQNLDALIASVLYEICTDCLTFFSILSLHKYEIIYKDTGVLQLVSFLIQVIKVI